MKGSRRSVVVIAVATVLALAVLTLSELALSGSSVASIPPLTSESPAVNVPCGTALASLRPAAGSTLALKRGCTYTGTLTVTSDDVTVTAYDAGSAPVITLGRDGAAVDIFGSDVTVSNLTLTGAAPRTWDCGGRRTPAGHVDGVDIEPGALDNTVTDISASGFYAGVYVNAGSAGNLIQDSRFADNTELDTNNPAGSSGAFGILLWGSDNTVQGNTITGSQACSIAYGHDGSAVEIFGGSHNLITDNQASNDNTFTELGSYAGATATSNTFESNTFSDGPVSHGTTFLVTRGSLDPDGPVFNTVAIGNSVTLTKPGDRGAVSYAWLSGDGTLLTMTSNYLNLGSNQVLFTDGGYVDGGGNTLTGTCDPASACQPLAPPLVR